MFGVASWQRRIASMRDAMTQPANGAIRRRADRSGDERRAGCAVVRYARPGCGVIPVLRPSCPRVSRESVRNRSDHFGSL